MKKITISLMFSAMLFAYTPTPYPVVQSGDPFIFDPAQCPSPAMGAFVVPVGSVYTGTITITEPDGEDVILTAAKITISSTPTTVKDTGDPLGLAVKHTFGWSWTPTEADIGLHYINVNVKDPLNAEDNRTLVLLIKVNQPPVITGCTN